MELKLCPFCGEKAEIFRKKDYDFYGYLIGCRTKGCFAEIEELSCITYQTIKFATEAWNQRA